MVSVVRQLHKLTIVSFYEGTVCGSQHLFHTSICMDRAFIYENHVFQLPRHLYMYFTKCALNTQEHICQPYNDKDTGKCS